MQSIKIEPFKLIGVKVRTTNENNKASKDIAKLWEKFLGENILNKIPNKENDLIYSLYTDYEGDHTKPYTAVIGCKVTSLKEIPDEMIGKSFDGGNYIKTKAKGDLTKGLIVNHWEKIFRLNLNRLFTADFEIFGEKAKNPVDCEVDFYVAVK